MDKRFFKTKEISIGKVVIGGNNPVAIQSMTDTKTCDIEKTTSQIIELHDLGCQIVRVTVQGVQEALATEKIKNNLLKKGFDIPIVADIHFYPKAALIAAEFVDKIRINPGNYAEKRATFKETIFSDKSYLEELFKIEEKLFPLIEKLKKRKIPIRLGVNFGSLSDRVMTKYGNTIEGMVISAIEYTDILRKHNFHDIVFSMKTSNPTLTIQAYTALVERQKKLGYDYPLHLGVTEAGDEEDGTVKSSIAIGYLLLNGIGDTIRVSLTENPTKEIKVAKKLSGLFLPEPSIKKINIPTRKKIEIYTKKNDKIYTEKNIELENFCFIENIDNFDIKDSDKNLVINFSSNILREIQNIYLKKLQFKKIILNIPNFPEESKIEDIAKISCLIHNNLINSVIVKETDKKNILDILQGLGLIKYKTEYISCPGCGRTLFDLQSTSKLIKLKTSHLKDLKIAVMGCIVNGPGEMQDADFGYVGSGIKKIDLYVGNECVEKNIDEKDALEKLIMLIKKMGRWVEPSKDIIH